MSHDDRTRSEATPSTATTIAEGNPGAEDNQRKGSAEKKMLHDEALGWICWVSRRSLGLGPYSICQMQWSNIQNKLRSASGVTSCLALRCRAFDFLSVGSVPTPDASIIGILTVCVPYACMGS